MYVYIQIKWSQWNIKTFAYIHTNYLQYPLFYYLKKHNATMSDSTVKNWKEKEKKKFWITIARRQLSSKERNNSPILQWKSQ